MDSVHGNIGQNRTDTTNLVYVQRKDTFSECYSGFGNKVAGFCHSFKRDFEMLVFFAVVTEFVVVDAVFHAKVFLDRILCRFSLSRTEHNYAPRMYRFNVVQPGFGELDWLNSTTGYGNEFY